MYHITQGKLKFLVILLSVQSLAFPVFGQTTKIELLKSDVLEYDKDVNGEVRRLIGDVAFKHEGAIMYCDSAYLHTEQNNVDAFGKIRIVQGDSLILTGKKLFYDGNKKVAQLFEDVVMTDRKMRLTTNYIQYDLNTNVASYTDQAKITDADNTLTSKTGYYFSRSKDLYFRKDVVLINPKYRMNCDTLRYNTTNKTSYFFGPTTIISDSNLIYCENGWYNTEEQLSSFSKNAYLKTKGQLLKGDSLSYNRAQGLGKAFKNVTINDSANKVTIGGDYAEYYEKTDSSFATGHALMTQLIEADTLFLHSDTLMAVGGKRDSTKAKRNYNMFAFHQVKIYKSDLQGSCDSLAYDYQDSTLRLFQEPVLWSGLNQLTADSISIQLSNSAIDKIYMTNSAFIASRADSLQNEIPDSLRFNQIRGKNMTGFFSDNKLHKIFVEGNGQTIYYGTNKNDQMIGVNRADCSNLMIYVSGNKVEQVVLLNKPEATFYPIHELSTRELRLKGFKWVDVKRPKNKEAIFEN